MLIGGYVVVYFALAGALHLVNAAAGGAVSLVRGTVVARHLPRPHKRRSRALFPHIITVQLVGLPEAAKLAVPNRPDTNRYTIGSAFVEPLRRGALGWWFAPKP